MYHAKGINEIIKGIRHVSGLDIESDYDFLDDELKNGYNYFLNKESVFENSLTEIASIKFTNFNEFKKIAQSFCAENEEHFSTNSTTLSERISSGFFHRALVKFQGQCSELYDIAQFVIKVVLLNQLISYTNGTTDKTIGLASMDFKDHFNEQDFIELLVHQMTHMLLFIDDRSHEHMIGDTKEIMIETGLKYVLGGTKFPAYIAFHSYIVGVEVLCFRERATGLHFEGNYHGSTERIIKICDSFQSCLIKNLDIFSERGKSIIENSALLIRNISHHCKDEYGT